MFQKTNQRRLQHRFDVYVRVDRYPSSPTKTTQQWSVGASGGFKTLDFRPDGDVRGSYWVEVSPDGKNFTATGISDVDGDGVYATYVATKSENPNSPTTAPDIY